MPEISRFSRRFVPLGVNGTWFAEDPETGAAEVHRHQDTDAEEATMRAETVETTSRNEIADQDRHRRPKSGSDTTRSARARVVQGLFEAHHVRVLAFLRRLTTTERAEDLAQEVFFRLFSVKNLESRDITVSYLFRIGENLVRKGYHRDVRHRRAGEDLRYRAGAGVHLGVDSTSGLPVGLSPEMTLVSNATLREALATLTDNEQAAIRLIVCRGLSYEQAACSLGVNISTINNWKHRGVKKLKRIIEDARNPQENRDIERSSSRPDDSAGHSRRIHRGEGSDSCPNPGGRLSRGRLVDIETLESSGELARRAG